MNEDKKNALRALIQKRALSSGGDFTLASGKKSSLYLDSKQVSLFGPGLLLVSEAFCEFKNKYWPTVDAIAGVSVGGDPLASGMVLYEAAFNNKEFNALLIRKEKKAHGMSQGRAVDGVLASETREVLLVEDVVSTGGSALKGAHFLIDEGYPLVGVLALCDREMGGVELLAKKLSLPVKTLFKISELKL